MILRTVVLLVALLVSSAGQADYFTFQKWSALSETSRAAYIAGVYDAGLPGYDMMITLVEGEQSGRYSRHYQNCIGASQMSVSQLAANVLNFAKDKPELHTGSVWIALLKYLTAACGEPPKK
jgi:hypothetical protein